MRALPLSSKIVSRALLPTLPEAISPLDGGGSGVTAAEPQSLCAAEATKGDADRLTGAVKLGFTLVAHNRDCHPLHGRLGDLPATDAEVSTSTSAMVLSTMSGSVAVPVMPS